MYFYYATGAFLALIIGSKVWQKLTAPGFKVKGKHLFLTGGSIGLGLETAIKYAKSGAKISIVARNLEKLKKAKETIEKACGNDTAVFIQSCDVSNFDQVVDAIANANEFHQQTTDHVICNAGISYPGYMDEQDISVYRKAMDVNYFGAVNTVKAALPAMIENKVKGKFVFISSGCGYIGFIGFTSYSPTKYALRGFADSLRNELLLHDMSVHVYYPGSMDTPGFAIENESKPAETMTIEGASELITAEQAANALIKGISDGEYAITDDLGIWVLRIISNGIAPRNNSFLEVLLLPFLVGFQIAFGWYMDYIVSTSPKKGKAKNKECLKKNN